MKRVYLDPNKWIELTKAAIGKPDGLRFKEVPPPARDAVERGTISFHISPTHYMELRHMPRDWQRHEVGGLMHELSRGDRIIGLGSDLLEGEIEWALRKWYGVPKNPRPIQVFGKGVFHAFGKGVMRGRVLTREGREPEGLDEAGQAWKEAVEEFGNDLAERTMLTGPPDSLCRF